MIQKFYVPGRDIGIEHLRQGHYIGGDEKKGFTISEMDISLPDQRLKLFARGRTDWRVENIGKKVKKSKRGRDIGIGTTRRLGSKPSTAKFCLLEE